MRIYSIIIEKTYLISNFLDILKILYLILYLIINIKNNHSLVIFLNLNYI